MIKVLHVLEATEGGTRRHLRDLALGLDRGRFDVSLAVSCRRDAAFAEDLPEYAAHGVAVHSVSMRASIAPVGDAAGWVRLARLIRRTAPDVVHAHSAKAGFLARAAGAACGVPVVYTPHVFPFLMSGRRRRTNFYRRLERLAVRWTAAVIAVSREEEAAALALGFAPGQVHVIANGLPGPPPPLPPQKSGAAVKVGFFGRLASQKGADMFLEAARVIRKAGVPTSFVMHGHGEWGDGLRERADYFGLRDEVTFAGAYAQGQALERMREVDIVVVPSRWEGCPYVILEAFRAGAPVVAFAVGGCRDLIRDNENGLLCRPGDAASLGEAVIRLADNPPLRQRLARQAWQDSAAYTAERMVRMTEAVYAAAVDGTKKRAARSHG